jgi:beta-lactamase superfamily II metal-dependent hydrolase
MRIEALGAAHGDALVVSWSDAIGTPQRGLIDGGPAARYHELLRPALDSLAAESGGGPLALDFVCVSHIDDDHIGGIERLFTELRRLARDGRPTPVQVGRLWFNGWDQLGMSSAAAASVAADPVVTASVRQGADLRDAARLLHVDGNTPVGGPLLAGTAFELNGLRVTVVAPGQEQLDKLMKVWKRAEGDAAVITAAYRDRSIPNLSSIAVLVESAGRRALLTGDARGDHLLTGLTESGLLTEGHLHVDVLKLPHHGSINNVDAGFFAAVSADHYIVSADGVTHGLPNSACLDLLLASRPASDDFELLLTNPMPTIEAHLAMAIGQRPVAVRVREDGQRAIADVAGP